MNEGMNACNAVNLNIIQTHLTHNSVSSSALLILEDDVWVAVDDELFEPGAVSCDAPLRQSAGAERVFRHVGRVLLEHERRHLAWTSALSGTAARTTRRHPASTTQQQHRH